MKRIKDRSIFTELSYLSLRLDICTKSDTIRKNVRDIIENIPKKEWKKLGLDIPKKEWKKLGLE